jgi:hypothetical protein
MSVIRAVFAFPIALLGMLLAFPILVVGLPFWIVNGLTRACARRWEPQAIRQVSEFDPVLGWRGKANLDCHVVEDRDDVFHVLTDEQGWPRTRGLVESKIVVIGDSHVWGYGVDHERAFFNLEIFRNRPHLSTDARQCCCQIRHGHGT